MVVTRRKVRVGPTVALCLALWCLARWSHDRWVATPPQTNVDCLEESVYDVDGVLSPFELLISRSSTGDEFHDAAVARQRARVRLLGIAQPPQWQPDAERWSRQATAAAQEFVRSGQVRVRLARRQMDQDGTLLAYCYVGDQLLNEYLVRQGWVIARRHADESSALTRQLREAQELACQSARGIWADPDTGW